MKNRPIAMSFFIAEDDENYRWDPVKEKWRCLHCQWQSKLATKTMYQAHFASKAISVHFQVKNCTDAPHELRNEMTELYQSFMQGKKEKKRVAELAVLWMLSYGC